MIRGILIVCAVLTTAPAFADPDIGGVIGGIIGNLIGGRGPGHPGRPGRPGNPGGYGMRCAAYDHGWEEHWSGHASCEECNRFHGTCIEECQYTEFTCVAEGDYYGRRFTVEGRSWDEYDAQQRALWECQQRGSRYCRLMGPCYQNEQANRRECNAWGGPGPGPRPRPGRGRH